VPLFGHLGDNFLLSSTINATLALLCNKILKTHVYGVMRAALPSADDQINQFIKTYRVFTGCCAEATMWLFHLLNKALSLGVRSP